MISAIERGGAGIEKSGTGIEKSGTGIERSGTGSRALLSARRKGQVLAIAALLASAPLLTHAEDSAEVFASINNGQLMISVHTANGIAIGLLPLANTSGYQQLALHVPVHSSQDSLLVQGSGSGTSGEGHCDDVASTMVQGSGSGSSAESSGACSSNHAKPQMQGSGSGGAEQSDCAGSFAASLMVQGSGSGSSGDSSTDCGNKLMVQGSGSGSSGEGSGICEAGSRLMIQGSGSGSSGEAFACGAALQSWGVAEVVFDAGEINILVHRRSSGEALIEAGFAVLTSVNTIDSHPFDSVDRLVAGGKNPGGGSMMRLH